MTCCSAFEKSVSAGAIEEFRGTWYHGKEAVSACPFCDTELPRFGAPPTIEVRQEGGGNGDVLAAIQAWIRLRPLSAHPNYPKNADGTGISDLLIILGDDGELRWILPTEEDQ